eukprot:4968265-Alexandrium_andersonii.AAC.1
MTPRLKTKAMETSRSGPALVWIWEQLMNRAVSHQRSVLSALQLSVRIDTNLQARSTEPVLPSTAAS